jgi:uncharacterized protein (TIGR03067 family)
LEAAAGVPDVKAPRAGGSVAQFRRKEEIVFPCQFIVVALVAPLLCVASPVADKEASPLLGEWTLVSAERDGKPTEDFEKFKGEKWTFTEGKVKSSGRMGGVESSYKADLSGKPMTIDMKIPFAKEAALGIVEVKGDTMTLCFGDTRPKSFDSKEGRYLIVLKKAK